MSILKTQIVRFFIAIFLSWSVVSLYSQDREGETLLAS